METIQYLVKIKNIFQNRKVFETFLLHIYIIFGKTVYMEIFKTQLKKMFLYEEPKNSYDFSLTKEPILLNEDSISNAKQNISNELTTNLEYIKVKYNLLINSDIIIREFLLNAKGKKYKACLIFIDGMVDAEIINNFVLKPLMLNNSVNTHIPLITKNKIHVKKIRKFNLENYIYNSLLTQNSVKKFSVISELIPRINTGECALLVDTLDVGFSLDVKGYQSRNISTPQNETVVRGSQEAFVEKIRTNTSMLRRLINNENLVIENGTAGKISKTQIAICYMKNIANLSLISEVKYRINNIDVDSIISSGQLEQLIQDNSLSLFPQIVATERPDKAANNLLEGRVIVIVNGSPYALIMPAVLIDFLASPEDINLKFQYSNLLKFIRILGFIITLFLPGFYIAITTYHTELIPTELLFTIAASRNTVPFPIIFEIFLMELSFELIREAGLRVPTPIGPTIGIVGALILGEAAVSANLVSPILIIIVAITAISSFSIPDFSLGFTLRVLRFIYVILGFMAGFLGIAARSFLRASDGFAL